MNVDHGNTIDTLDKLLGVKSNPSRIDYYKLWIKTVLEQRTSTGSQLFSKKISTIDENIKEYSEILSKNKEEHLDDYIMCYILRHICQREMLNWKGAFNALMDIIGFSEYGSINESYYCYLFGRLFYDIQEYYGDYLNIKRQFVNKTTSDISNVIQFYNYNDIEEKLQIIFPNEEDAIHKLLDKAKGSNSNPELVATHYYLAIAEFFFEKALQKDEKEHYYAWKALTLQKKGRILFYSYNYKDCIQVLKNAIRMFDFAIKRANKVITNLYFNQGLCNFYLEMIYLFIDNYIDPKEATQNFERARYLFSKSLDCKDESYVKSEYTFRRSELDVYYYRLIAYRDYIDCMTKIPSINKDYLYQIESTFIIYVIDFFKMLKRSRESWRVEYLISLAKIVDYISVWINTNNFPIDGKKDYWDDVKLTTALLKNEFGNSDNVQSIAEEIVNFIRGGQVNLSKYIEIKDLWDEARNLDLIKFEWPFRFGLAFQSKQYEENWLKVIRSIMSELKVNELSEANYDLFQNPKIKAHYQKDAGTNR